MTAMRTATREDLSTILDWAAEEGWNPGLDDAAAFHAADPEGFFVALDGDTPVAAISVVNHSAAFAFLGLYLVRPAWRGRGLGLGLWTHALAHAGTRTVGLDGVEAQQANYAASGFVHAGGTTRFSGDIAPRADPQVRAARPAEHAQLVAAEAAASGQMKAAYLSAWVAETQHRRTLVLEEGGHPRGFCTVRRCRSGAKIGPLVARNRGEAERLMRHAATVFGPELIVDVPGASAELVTLCAALGMTPGFRTARMYRGPFAPPPPGLFAVTSLELG